MTDEERIEEKRQRLRAIDKRYREKNGAKIAAKNARWRAANPERYAAGQKAWFERNKAHRRAYSNERVKRLRQSNPEFKLGCTLRMRLIRAVRAQNTEKGAKTTELVGCLPSFLIGHLEKQFRPGMTWANHGSVWEIDHIRPCAAFNLENVEEQKKCFHYSNLQPLFSEENRSKGAREISTGKIFFAA